MPQSTATLTTSETTLDPAGQPKQELLGEGDGAYVEVLGTAQDGGVPHPGCGCERCVAARSDRASRRLVASIAVVVPEAERSYLIDATPDMREQLDHLGSSVEWGVQRGAVGTVDKAPLLAGGTASGSNGSSREEQRSDPLPITGIFLTHAHIGHYLGLAFLGEEAAYTHRLPIYCTPKMAQFLAQNAPWSRLLTRDHVVTEKTYPGESIEVADGISIRSITANHRADASDTVGYVIRGPERAILYVPDSDAWTANDPIISDVLGTVDSALLDGTFYSASELPAKLFARVPHPPISTTMDLLDEVLSQQADDAPDVFFTHLNHTNPVCARTSDEAAEVRGRGYRILNEGQRFAL